MADEIKMKFKDARTARELLAHLRSDAALLASDVQASQRHFALFLLANIGLVSLYALLSGPSYSATAWVVMACAIPLVTMIVSASEYLAVLNRKTHLFIEREFAELPVEQAIERLIPVEITRIKSLLQCRNVFRIVNVVLVLHLGFIGLGIIANSFVTSRAATMP